MRAINLKSDLTYVNTQFDTILTNSLNYDTIDASTIKFKLKSNITYVDTSCQAIINIFQYYETILGTDLKLFDKADKVNTCLKTAVNVALSILQAGIDRRVQINTVDKTSIYKK